MPDSIQLSACAQSKLPEMCPLCKTERPFFEYAVSTDPLTSGETRQLRGFCCLPCAQQFLVSMAELTLAEWKKRAASQ